LKQAIAEAFRPEDSLSPWERRRVQAQQQSAQSLEKGHGRVEQRHLTRTTELNDYLDWPGVRQVFRLQRQRTVKSHTAVEEVYGITSLSPEQADAERLLSLVRGHWGIENSLHWVRDVTFGEDACRVRTGQAPRFLAACRNLAISLLHRTGARNKAAALRYDGAKPHEAIILIRGSPEN
jgi:predicted transposase YbfD/YdcC